MKRWLVASFLALAAFASAQLTSSEKRGLEDTLFIGGMTLQELEYERQPFRDKYRLPIVDAAIARPLEGADRLMALHAAGNSKSLAEAIRSARTLGLADPRSLTIVNSPRTDDPELKKLPQPLQAPVKRIVEAVADANAIVKRATEKLSAEEVRYLIEALPLYANEEPSIKFGYTSRTSYDATRLLALVDKIDLPSIRAAAEQLASSIESTRPALEAAAKGAPADLRLSLRIDGLRIDVNGTGDDLHESKDAVITIDLGGNDTYRGRHGAGVGYSSVLIDLAGNDTFDVPDLSLGAGLVGIGLVYDIGGHDVFRCKSITLGCGLAGVGAIYREGGRDTYEAVSLAQGFGEFGVGILLDTAGADRYDGAYNVQGAARTGGIGWQIDLAGDDVYRAGGLILNAPLFATVHYSNGQGYGSGYREDTGGTSGGVGLLTDLKGDDNYLGETYCQAASYWFAIGSLYDAEGFDTYSAYHYAQASAMHMTGAYLFDLAGDDSYLVKLGACHAIGHDYGVGFLLDRAGMDVYAAHDSRPAVGNANGLGIFLEGAGDDRYFGPTAAANPSRGSGSLALFADLGGSDIYGAGLADDQARVGETWGVSLDQAGAPPAVAGSSGGGTTTKAPTPGSIPKPGDAEMAAIYAKAIQWGVGTAQQEVADNVNKLIGIGLPAVQWMMDKRLAASNRLSNRAFVAVINGIGGDARTRFAPKVASENLDEARNALSIVVSGGMKEASPYLGAALKKPELQRAAAAAVGALASREAIPDVLPLTIATDRITALNAMTSLVALADPTTVPTAEALLGSTDLPIRKAAIALIARVPKRAMEIGSRYAANSDVKLVRIGIEILGALGTPEALSYVGSLLRSPLPGVRIGALLALDGRVPQEFRPQVIELKKDPDLLVRSVAARIDLGR